MSSGPSSVFAGFRFPREVIAVAVHWYLRYGLSYRDVEELLAERGVTVDHVTVYRWVQRFTPEFIEAARLRRHAPGDRWFADETYVKVAGRWTYLYRAIAQHGQVIDVLLSERRDLAAARRFFTGALRAGTIPAEVTTAPHTVERYANDPVEADHAFVQNLRRGHYELATDVPARHRDPRSIRPARDGHLTAGHSRQRPLSGAPINQRNTAPSWTGLLWCAGRRRRGWERGRSSG